MIRTLKQYVPWWGKLGSKLVLARVPLTYAIWRRIGLFEHGAMLDGDYARGVFDDAADAQLFVQLLRFAFRSAMQVIKFFFVICH